MVGAAGDSILRLSVSVRPSANAFLSIYTYRVPCHAFKMSKNMRHRRTNVTQMTSEIRNSEIALSLEDTETVLLMPSTGVQTREERSEESRKWLKRLPHYACKVH